MNTIHFGRVVPLMWVAAFHLNSEFAYAQSLTVRQVPEITHYSDVHTTSLPMVTSAFPEGRSKPSEVVRGPYRSVQVNVDAWGQNILGDAANEPSITADPNDPRKMAIGWRQFNSPYSTGLREAGVAFTRTAGHHWTFPGPLLPGVYGSDPVLDVDSDGTFYYISTSPTVAPTEFRVFKSYDGGVTWSAPIRHALGVDKPWIAIDRTGRPTDGIIFFMCSCVGGFMRSTNRGETFDGISIGSVGVGTASVSPDGELYLVGSSSGILRSLDPMQSEGAILFDLQRPLQYFDDAVTYRPRFGG